jgi:4-amino-4-deoxy-L-arabinose transferase-like glycosyltransferase
LLIALQLVISFFVMRGDSATVDEVAHIADGYSIVAHQDYRFNPEHPPLTKVLAGLPLLGLNLVDIQETAGWDDYNQWTAGRAFLYFVGNDADRMLFFARLPMLFLLLLLGLYVARFAVELFGRRVALVVLFFFALTPELLAHGHLVTTDVGAALGFTAATYHFYQFLKKRTRTSLVVAGIALGVAQLFKFSAVLLVPIDLVLIVLWCALQMEANRGAFWKPFAKLAGQYLLMGLIGLALVWAAYIPTTWNTPVNVEHAIIERSVTYDAEWVPYLRERLHALAENPVTRGLGHYALGIYMVFHRVDGGNNTFILGQFDDKGIWWFFPVAWVMKTAIPIMLLFFASLVYVFSCRSTVTNDQRWRAAVLLVPVLFYWVVTMMGSLNLGIRHLLPTVPFVLLFCGELVAVLLRARSRKGFVVLGMLMLWMAASVGVAYPHYLAYFNEFTIAQPKKYELLVDSSLDWGQDAKRLAVYAKNHGLTSLTVDYFGGGQPDYYMPGVTYWHSSDGPIIGDLAVSATFYQFSRLAGPKEGTWSYDWLRPFEPVAVIGNSILVYHITEEDLRAHPPTSPYPVMQPPGAYVVDPNNFLSQ